MRRAQPLLLILALVGCGYPLQLATNECPGRPYGTRVYTDASGGTTCAQALDAVEWAHAYGIQQSLWGANETWPFYEIQFVNEDVLPPELDNAWGRTAYAGNGAFAIWIAAAVSPTQTRATLLHEFLHASYGEWNHCNWSVRYTDVFRADGDRGAFTDGCRQVSCWGPDYICPPITGGSP